MNRLSIALSQCADEEGGVYEGVLISLDGRDLREIAREHEAPFAQKEGHPDLAGSYSLLDVRYTSPEVFLSKAEREYGIDDDKVALMGCSCGVVSCWPLVCRIDVSGDSVTWSHFEQPHRSLDSAASHWDLSGLGPFVFERAEYVEALSILNCNG